jgi:hypothetical protein
MDQAPDDRPLLGFNVMLKAEDAHGECFLAYGCAARDADEAARLAEGAASAEGFWSIEVDEVWRPEGVADVDLGTVPEVFGRLEPTYLDDEEIDVLGEDDEED